MTVPMPQEQPQQVLQPPTPPWTPFATLPVDTEPDVARVRKRRLLRLIQSVRFTAQPKEWQAVAIQAYMEARQAIAAAQQAQAQAQGVSGTQPKPPATPKADPMNARVAG